MGIKRFIINAIKKSDYEKMSEDDRVLYHMKEGFEGICEICKTETRVWKYDTYKACPKCIDEKKNEGRVVPKNPPKEVSERFWRELEEEKVMRELEVRMEEKKKEELLQEKIRSEHQSKERKGFPDSVRQQVLKKQNISCANCKKFSQTWDFDHIDGDRSNNKISNCQALCPNCHALKSRHENL